MMEQTPLPPTVQSVIYQIWHATSFALDVVVLRCRQTAAESLRTWKRQELNEVLYGPLGSMDVDDVGM